ncbi:MAG TPA: M23 family metallopeptidase [Gemmatimonadaceae bacterium]|nr:M23 family metallopeptidase [Gemmatimonadaceae bacterium]
MDGPQRASSQSQRSKSEARGYGNIYTPHAGAMIIQVQREAGLANRTIVLSNRQVRLLRFCFSRPGILLLGAIAASWVFFAVQAVRVPLLTGRIRTMERDAVRLDTLQATLAQLTARYEQVQTMLGAAAPKRAAAPPGDAVRIPAEIPSVWPLPNGIGFVTRGTAGPTPFGGAHPGVDVAVASGTDVRAAGAGSVVEVGNNAEYGIYLRLAHTDGYETLYGHLSRTLVERGATVATGTVVALTGNTGRSTGPHLHFEVRRRGANVDPLQIIKKGT